MRPRAQQPRCGVDTRAPHAPRRVKQRGRAPAAAAPAPLLTRSLPGGSQRIRGAGKPHKSGLGAQLMHAVNGGARTGSSGRGAIGQYAHLFTADVAEGQTTMQSVLEMSDLDEMMAMAELAGRDFAAQRNSAVVVSLGGDGGGAAAAAARAAARRAAADAAAGRLTVPRRPPWRPDMQPAELDARERESFLVWRRDLASLEEGEAPVSVTPFEKNLNVWRQLWRVLERSDLVCQVVDARDPLRYRCADLEAYAKALGDAPPQHGAPPPPAHGGGRKRTLLLLNKADLLPRAAREAWAAFFEAEGSDYVFWSALAASEATAEEIGRGVTAVQPPLPPPPVRGVVRSGARVVGREELLSLLEARAAAAAAGRGNSDDEDASSSSSSSSVDGGDSDGEAEAASGARSAVPRHDPRRSRRVVVGLVGYPNVGKSSTLNALVGSKRTGVGPTPGKTKHFQTFLVSPTLQLADCPGLVFPSFCDGRAELVAAGVLPIDRLTDVVAPLDLIASRIPRAQLEAVYALKLPQPAAHEPRQRPATGRELLRGYAASRGLTSGAGLPDETRAGRAILKDYTTGKLLFYEMPPGWAPAAGTDSGPGGGSDVAPCATGAEEAARFAALHARVAAVEAAAAAAAAGDGGGEEASGEGSTSDDDEWEGEAEEEGGEGTGAARAGADGGGRGVAVAPGAGGSEEEEGGATDDSGEDAEEAAAADWRAPSRTSFPPVAPSSASTTGVGNALLGELRALGLAGPGASRGSGGRGACEPARAGHKLQKKGKKEKLRRLARGPAAPEGVGGALITGRKGGLMPASAQVAALPEYLPALARHGGGIMMAADGRRSATSSARRPDSRMSAL